MADVDPNSVPLNGCTFSTEKLSHCSRRILWDSFIMSVWSHMFSLFSSCSQAHAPLLLMPQFGHNGNARSVQCIWKTTPPAEIGVPFLRNSGFRGFALLVKFHALTPQLSHDKGVWEHWPMAGQTGSLREERVESGHGVWAGCGCVKNHLVMVWT